MALNHYKTLGYSGLRVSPFCLGTMTFGEDWGWGSSPQDSQKIMDRYIERGGNFIDTANLYTKGHSEAIIGNHLANDKAKRQKLVIATKFFGSLHTGDPNAGGAGRKALIASCEESLRRLKMDYIDLFWMHCWDKHTPIEETMRALDDLVRAGKIRYVGFSDTPAWKITQAAMLAKAHGWAPLIAMQLEYSLLERTIEGEHVPMAKEFGLGITPWSPLKQGVLTGKFTRANAGRTPAGRGEWVTSALNENAYRVIDVLIEIAKELDSTPARVALSWVQGRPGVTSTILGARTLSQLEDNLSALDVELTTKQRERLTELTSPQLNFPAGFLENSGPFGSSGTTINGETYEVNPIAPANDQERF